jgi:hypothetical protein
LGDVLGFYHASLSKEGHKGTRGGRGTGGAIEKENPDKNPPIFG